MKESGLMAVGSAIGPVLASIRCAMSSCWILDDADSPMLRQSSRIGSGTAIISLE